MSSTAHSKDFSSASARLTLYGKVSLLLAATLALLTTGIVAPAMPDIAAEFGAELQLEWLPRSLIAFISLFLPDTGIDFIIKLFILSVPALFIVISAPMVGVLSDFWGRKTVLALSLAGFSVAGTSGYFVDSLTGLLAGRALLGVFVSGIIACTVAMVGDYFDGEERNRFIGLQGAAMKIGGVSFLMLGGYFADISWRAPFLVYLAAFIALPGVILHLYEDQAPTERISSRVTQVPWRPVSFILITIFITAVFFFMILIQVPFFLDMAFDVSKFQIGLAVAAANTVAGIVSTQFHRVKAAMSYRSVFAVVFLMMGLGFVAVSLAPDYGTVLVGLGIAGCGIGLIIPTQGAWMLSVVPAERRGAATGMIATSMYLGQFLAPAIIEPVLNPSDPFHVFKVAAGVLLVLALVYKMLDLL